LSQTQGISPSETRFWNNLQNAKVLRSWVVRPYLTIYTGVPTFVGCTRLLIQYIRSYRQYLEAISSIRKTKKV